MNGRNILFVDVQAVGSPGNGFPMEIAWKSPGSDVHCFFFWNEDPQIPLRVRSLTGIEPSDLSGPRALHASEIKQLFLSAAGIPMSPVLLVAHHSLYEKKWIDFITGMDLPFTCTRQMALNSVGELRSGSLRAVAGLTGHVMSKFRRAEEHVLATESIYNALLRGFSHEPVSREKRLSLPHVPGVYLFLDPAGNTLYVGKAKNLRSRVNSHFTGKATGRQGELLSRVCRIEFRETETAFHAAVVESELISALSPEYNRAGKITEKGLWYLSSDLTRVLNKGDESGCFGPFTGRGAVEIFARLLSAMKSSENKMTIVENLLKDVPISLIDSVFDNWRKPILRTGILTHGRRLYLERSREAAEVEKALEKVVDEESVREQLNGILIHGALLCRRAAALRLVSGCTVKWSAGAGSENVHNFVENSATEQWDQAKVRKLMVVLSELKRLYRSGWNPRLITGNCVVLSGERLGSLMDLL